MELVSDRDRRISVEDLNTSQLLAHATRQAHQRKFDDLVIVDVDSHHVELDSWTEVLATSRSRAAAQRQDDVGAPREERRAQQHPSA